MEEGESVAEEKQKVVIIGGGITGLQQHFIFKKQLQEHNLPIEIKLIEASHRLGGKMQTVIKDGYTIERGPDSFLERKKSITRLS